MTNPTIPPGPAPTGPTRLTARTPEDLLAAAAVVLGFWPSESVVMLTFDAAHPFHARVDLPAERASMPELAETLAEPAVHHRVGRVVLLFYSADLARARAAWRALRSVLGRHGIAVAEALVVGGEQWWPLREAADRDGGAGVGFDPDRLAAHPFLAQAVVEGRVLHRSRAALADSLAPDEAAVARVAAELARPRGPGSWAGFPRDLGPASAQLATGSWAHALVSRHLEAEPPDTPRRAGGAVPTGPSDAEAARLLWSMQTLRVRDAAWSAVTRSRARPAVAFFTGLLRRAPREHVPAVAALLAWAAWQAGDGALAWCALDRCDEVDPAYGLSALVAEALERAVPPSVMAEGFDWKEGLDGRETG